MPKSFPIYSRRPLALPNPPFPRATQLVVVKAIVEAWRVLRDEPRRGFDLSKATEDQITLELRNCLVDDVLESGRIKGFDPETFVVSREPKYESYDRTHPDKMPDLHVAVMRDCRPGQRSADGIFVECKPVDRDRTAGAAYCDKGLIRFVKGEYAWAMPHALMVGYADTGYTVDVKLKVALGTRKRRLKTSGDVVKGTRGNLGGYAQDLHQTTHKRGFTYPATKTKAPEITIDHVWLALN